MGSVCAVYDNDLILWWLNSKVQEGRACSRHGGNEKYQQSSGWKGLSEATT